LFRPAIVEPSQGTPSTGRSPGWSIFIPPILAFVESDARFRAWLPPTIDGESIPRRDAMQITNLTELWDQRHHRSVPTVSAHHPAIRTWKRIPVSGPCLCGNQLEVRIVSGPSLYLPCCVLFLPHLPSRAVYTCINTLLDYYLCVHSRATTAPQAEFPGLHLIELPPPPLCWPV